MKTKSILIFVSCFLVFLGVLGIPVTFLHAQPDSPSGEDSNLPDPTIGIPIKWTFGCQFWTIYSLDQQADIDGDDQLDNVDNRLDFFLRRARLGLKGTLVPKLDYSIVFAYDQLGRNEYTATTGSIQDKNNLNFFLWDALSTWHVTDFLCHISFGYFRPQVGRESITSAFAVNSFMKALTNSYPRIHVVGRGNGRETGINIGGLVNKNNLQLIYNCGLFDTNHPSISGDLNDNDRGDGIKWSPLVSGRFVLSLGDREMEKYDISYITNYFGKRNGISIALNGSYQAENDTFKKNSLLGMDVLANYGNFCLSTEYDLLDRESLTSQCYRNKVYHIRAGYTMPLTHAIIEPVFLFSRYEGNEDALNDGIDELLDFGVNCYLRQNKLKVYLHYTRQDGEATSGFTDGKTFQRGDFIGLGIQIISGIN